MRCTAIVFIICIGTLPGCSVPMRPLSTPLRLYDTFTTRTHIPVYVYECWDSVHFAQARYIPFFLFRPADPRAPLYVAAWQEFLGRFAGPLRPAQKELLQSILNRSELSDSIAQWRIPIYEGEVSDLRHTTPVRNLYWSIDRYGADVTELAVLWLRSYPQLEPWHPSGRPPAFWHQLQQEAHTLYPELKRHIERDLERYATHTPLAP